VPGCAWHVHSLFHIYIGEDCPIWVEDGQVRGELDVERLSAGMSRLTELRHAMLLRGVDLFKDGGLMSAAHSEADLEQTVTAFEDAVRTLQ
jgi:glutamate-1-semialdehyde aminotransferase